MPFVAGLDVGGMIAFAAARDHGDRIRGAAVMNTVVPGLDPWDKLLVDPRIFHFAFHAVPGLPETLVEGRERAYFDFFLDMMSGRKGAVPDDLRETFVAAYRPVAALSAGFGWYRAMADDARHNARHKAIDTPILFLRGDADHRPIEPYLAGARKVGAQQVSAKVIPDSGEFLPLEQPAALCAALLAFEKIARRG